MKPLSTLLILVSSILGFTQDFPAAYYKALGIVNFYERNYLDAVRAFQKAAVAAPTDRETLKLLAMVYDSIGDTQLSQKTRVRAQALNVSFGKRNEIEVPSLKNDLRALGNEFYNRGIYDSAAQCYELHLRNFKEDTSAIFFLANSLFFLNDYQKAVSYYDLLIALDHNRADAYNLAGVCYQKQKDYLKARDYFRQCLLKNDKYAAAYYNLGEIYLALEDFRLAQLNLEKAHAFLPRDKEVLLLLGRAYTLDNQPQKAIDVLGKLLALDEKNPIANFETGKIFFNQKKYEKALPFFVQSLASEDNPSVTSFLGQTYFHLSDFANALPHLKTATEIYPYRKELHYQTAAAANFSKQYTLAEAHAQKAIALDEKYKEAYLQLITALKGLKRKKDAKKYQQIADNLN